MPTRIVAAERVYGPDGLGAVVDSSDKIKSQYFVRHGQIEPKESGRMQSFESNGKVFGRNVETEIAPRVEARVGFGHFSEGGVVHRRTDRVLDRMPQHREGSAFERPVV